MAPDLPAAEGNEATVPVAEPVPSTNQQLRHLQIILGLGLFLTLFVSIWDFGGYISNQRNYLLRHIEGGNYFLWAVVELLLNGKAVAMIAIAVGAGIVFYLQTKTWNTGKVKQELYIRLQLGLILLGLINGLVFLWTNDLLFHLGIMGLLLFPFVRLQPKKLFIAVLVCSLVFCAKHYWDFAEHSKAYTKYRAVTAIEEKHTKDSADRAKAAVAGTVIKKDTLTKAQQEDKSAWEGIAATKKTHLTMNQEGFKEMRAESYKDIWAYLLPSIQSREVQWFYRTGIWDLAAMMFLGMALYKLDFFGSSFSNGSYALIGLGGITAGLLFGVFRLWFDHFALMDYGKYLSGTRVPYNLYAALERICCAVGYCSFVMLFLRVRFLAGAWNLVALSGKMALSNYLLQSVVCTLFFDGFGFGYFGRLPQAGLYLFAAELVLVQVVFSYCWLRYFGEGPVEWLIKCAIHGQWLPNNTSEQGTPISMPAAS